MHSLFETLNEIDDDLRDNILSGKEAIEGATIIVVDDAEAFDIQRVVDEFSKDRWDEDSLDEDFEKPQADKIIVSKEEVKDILDKIATCRNFDIKKTWKNNLLAKKNNLTEEDKVLILKQLKLGDYNYTLLSNREDDFGTHLHVFITSRAFNISDRIFDGVSMYIKLKHTPEEGVICVLSLHDSKKNEKHPYAEEE